MCLSVLLRERCIVTVYNSPSCLIVLSATFKSAALSALGMAVAKTFWSFSTVRGRSNLSSSAPRGDSVVLVEAQLAVEPLLSQLACGSTEADVEALPPCPSGPSSL